MKIHRRLRGALLFAGILAAAGAQSVTDPHITSWLTSKSAQYARIYETTSDKSSGNAVSTWPRSGLSNSGGGQSTAAYADVQRVAYSTNYVYITTTGLASYTMGNWLNPQGAVFMFWPTNRAAIHRIPRNLTIPTTKAKATGVGGVWLNGVYLWENGDAQSYTTSTGAVSFNGAGIWNRLAGAAEAFNFDPANGHQPSSGAYHTHINPIGLRYQLGDNVTYNSSTKTYSEAGTPTKHSPILGWALDGLPVYGPYGYSSALDATSGIRRMTSGFQKRDGTNGSTNLTSTGRTTLPVWSASVQGKSQTLASTEYGPNVNTTYPLGTFAEDYDYLGDRGKTQGVDFDLNAQNVRYCVTPEFPNGTYAYFVSIDSSGTTAFPDVINQQFFASPPTGNGQGTVTSISEPVTEYADAGPATAIAVTATASGGGVALSWNSAEGATYKVESSPDNSTWTTLTSGVTSGGLTTSTTAAAVANYFRVTLTALATYDSGGTYGTAVGKTATVQFANAATAPSITTQPSNVTVTAGASATFTVVASGTAPLSYQWQKAGATISGATAATYSIATAQSTDAGNYTVVVSNSAGSVTSNTAALTVDVAAPTITTQPASATVTTGASVTFSVVASGTTPLSYQWQKSGTAISGATSASFAMASAQSTDAGSYTVVVSNSAGSVTSNTITLTVNAAAPTITTQPANATVAAGAAVTFSVVASGTAPLSYQWQKSGSAISGATSATYAIASVQPADAGSYIVVVSNSGGSVSSNTATLTVNAAAPTITTPPSSATVTTGATVTFSVVASGTAPLAYQWQKAGAPIAGATSASFTIASAQTGDAGSYNVIVSNSVGTATRSAGTLIVNAPAVAPGITVPPAPVSVTTGATATFTVVASGTAPLAYQWLKSGAAISGAISASFSITGAQAADAGNYSVTISNSAGAVTSSAAALSVTTATVAPAITAQPASITVSTGAAASFTIVASGTAPLTYQWQKAGVAIAGATAATLTIASAQAVDAAGYACVVSNSAGSVTSDPAILTVSTAALAPAITAQPASVNVNVGNTVIFTVTASGTAPLAYQWQKNGAPIAGASSASLTVANVDGTSAGSYACVVSNAAGSATSNVATLTVTTPAVAPTITAQPANATVTTGGSATFSVVASGTAPLAYQWQKNGVAVAGATASAFSIATTQSSDAGNYGCVVSNSAGSITSSPATLTVTTATVAPSIATQPAGSTVNEGAAANFTVAANGTAPLTFQWQKNGTALAGATSATLVIATVRLADAGNYGCVVSNSAGSVTSDVAVLAVNAAPAGIAPVITSQPAGATITAGSAVTFTVTATGTAPLAYQWRKDGVALASATSSSLALSNVQSADAGSYSVVVSNGAGTITSAAAALQVAAIVARPAARIVNLAVRTRVGGAAGTPTVGFVMNGAAAGKQIIIRAVGPSLAALGVTGVLANPRLQLWSGGAMLLANDDWLAADAPAFSAVGAFPLVAGAPDAAIVATLPSGSYTTPLSITAGDSGIVLIECYDGAPVDSSARLINASALAYVGTGDDALIPGFVIDGEGTVRILVRAVGPGLAPFGVTNALPDPTLALYRDATVIGVNNDWGASANPSDITAAAASVGAFALPKNSFDAALLVTLPAGAYSAIVSGVGGATGPALVEIYVVP
jgi:hypothetical protein